MICKGCGNDIPDNQILCPSCGSKLDWTSNTVNTKKCIRCGKGFADTEIICDICGESLTPMHYQVQGNPTNYTASNQAVDNQQQSNYMINESNPNSQGQGPNQAPNQGQFSPYSERYQGAKEKQSLKRKNSLSPLFIIILVVGIILLSAIAIGITGFLGYRFYKKYKTNSSESLVNDSRTDLNLDGIPEIPENGNQDNYDEINPGEGELDGAEIPVYKFRYSYTELPDVISIDSDVRFTYYNQNLGADVITYTYVFQNTDSSSKDFYDAIESYCSYLITLNGFYYEEEFSLDQYNETGVAIEYLSKDNTVLGIESSIEPTGWFVHINIYDISEEVPPEEDDSSEITYNYYSYYLKGRDSIDFNLAEEVIMENGIAFYLDGCTVTDLGDGTAQVDCVINLLAVKEDTYLYTDSFLILPMDREGHNLGDVCLLESLADESEQFHYVPYLLSIEEYRKYTLSFKVPAETELLSIYGTNLLNGFRMGPTYDINIDISE